MDYLLRFNIYYSHYFILFCAFNVILLSCLYVSHFNILLLRFYAPMFPFGDPVFQRLPVLSMGFSLFIDLLIVFSSCF